MVGVASLVVGIVQLLLLSLVPTVMIWLAVDAGRIQAAVRRRRSGTAAAEDVAVPHGLPIEEIASAIRRLAAEIEAIPPGAPLARRDAAVGAYDDALAAACRALDVVDALTTLPAGADRDGARAQVEHELALAGLVIRGPQVA
jgi:hypothetical protein